LTRQDDELAPLRQTLADLLVTLRKGAGLTQRQLAKQIVYSRETVAGAETCSRQPALKFWQNCDAVLGGRGELRRLYDQFAATRREQTRQRADQAAAVRAARRVLLPPAVDSQARESSTAIVGAALPAQSMLDWLLEVRREASGMQRRVGMDDVRFVDALTVLYRAADYRFGGGAVLSHVDRFAESAASLLRGRYAGDVAPALHHAVAGARQLAGWVAFDVGAHANAQRHWAAAERSALMAEDLNFAARIRYSQARQLQHLRWNEDALATLVLAREQADDRATPAVQAMLWVAEAASHAALGDRRAALTALSRATDAFGRIEPASEPAWMGFFGEAELFAQYGRVHRDLARQDRRLCAETAVGWVDQALHAFEASHDRSYTLNLVGLCSAYFLAGAVDDGLEVALTALDRARGLTSARVWDRITNLRRDFETYLTVPSIGQLERDIISARAELPVPTVSGSRPTNTEPGSGAARQDRSGYSMIGLSTTRDLPGGDSRGQQVAPTEGRFTEATMQAALHEICQEHGLSADDATLLRLTNNAVFLLPRETMVVRIARTAALLPRVAKVARLAAWFERVGAPTIRLAPRYPRQPVSAGHSLATIWQYLPPTQTSPNADDLGTALRQFHALGVPPFELPAWDPVDDARRRLGDAEGLDDADRQYLLDWCDRLDPVVTEVVSCRNDIGLIHGDAHVGNLLRTSAGEVVLCDFDATAVGPVLVDLAAVAVGDARFARSQYQQLHRAYGRDVTTDPSWPAFKEARELKMIVAAVPLLASGPGVREEFAVRLRSVREQDDAIRWTPFAQLRS
jgi:DNA-binding XRE family transcriptional regulator/tetratricopeptide (TPR) repeat protein